MWQMIPELHGGHVLYIHVYVADGTATRLVLCITIAFDQQSVD